MSKPILTMADMKEAGDPKTVKRRQAQKRVSREELNDIDDDADYIAKSIKSSRQVDEREPDYDNAPIARYFDKVA